MIMITHKPTLEKLMQIATLYKTTSTQLRGFSRLPLLFMMDPAEEKNISEVKVDKKISILQKRIFVEDHLWLIL